MTLPGLELQTRVDPSVGGGGVLADSSYASLSAAVTAIGATRSTLRISTALYPNGANVTVPETLTLEFTGAGTLNLTTGQTVTILSDPSNWPIRKIFVNALASEGSISLLGNPSLQDIFPQWWGAIFDDATDCAPSINAAFASLGSTSVTRGGPNVPITGPAAIASTVLITRQGLVLRGTGWGKQGSTTASSYLRWIGAAGTAQVETATVVGTITTSGNAVVIITAVGMVRSPKSISVPVLVTDSASTVAGKIRTVLTADSDVTHHFTVGGASAAVALTRKIAIANDTTLNININNDTCVGLTAAPTSANTTAGVLGSPMVKLLNVTGQVVRDLQLIGNSSAKPSCAINLNQQSGFAIHANSLENIRIGGGEVDTGDQFTHGLLLDGVTGSNSELMGRNIDIIGCAGDGVHVSSSFNIGLQLDGLYTNGCGNGVWCAGGISGTNWVFNANDCDLYLPDTDDFGAPTDPHLDIRYFHSENSSRLAMLRAGNLTIEGAGSAFTVGTFTNVDGKVVDASGFSPTVNFVLRTFQFTSLGSPPTAPFLDFSGTAGHGGSKSIVLDGVHKTVLTGGTNGLTVLTGDATDVRYVYYREMTRPGANTVPVVAQNLIGTYNEEWDQTRFDIPTVAPPPITLPNANGTAVFALDQSDGDTLTIANNDTETPFGNANNFSGVFSINDRSITGATGWFVCGGGGSPGIAFMESITGSFSITPTTASRLNIYYNSGVLTIENKLGSAVTITVTPIRMRASQ